jgi:predicted aminopeptidase
MSDPRQILRARRPPGSWLPAHRWVLLLALALGTSACSPAYVLLAGLQEAKILWRRQPIVQVLRRPDLEPATRVKLESVLAVRDFAATALQLRVAGSYASYATVDADQVVHVVTAAERLRLQPYTWWFPIVGRVPYKGYFDKTAAESEAAALENAGYDTFVRPSVAFSTLGWFDDPLLSTLLRYDEVTLAEVIIHELLHNTIYIGGHADFDESFASFVGSRGAVAFFAGRGDTNAAQRALTAWNDSLMFSAFLGRGVARLRTAYGHGITLAERQRLFAELQDEFRTLPLQTEAYQGFATRTLNNAIILHYLVYADRLPIFEQLWQQEGEDLARVIQRVRVAVGNRNADPFAAVEALLDGDAGAPLPAG